MPARTSDPVDDLLAEADAFLASRPAVSAPAAGDDVDALLAEADAFLAKQPPPASFGERFTSGLESAWSTAIDVTTQRPLARRIAAAVSPGVPEAPPAPPLFGGPAQPEQGGRRIGPAPMAPPDNQFVEGALSGASSIVGGLGGAVQAARAAGYGGPGTTLATNPVGEGARRIGVAMSGADAAVQAAFPTPEALAGDIRDRPQLLTDPDWWKRGAGQVLGSALPYLGAARGAMLVPEALEAVTEGGSAYNDAIAAGKTPEEAAIAAAGVTAANLAIVPGFNRLGELAPAGKVGQMAMEALQEGAQEVPQNVAAGKPVGEGVANALVLGGIGGAAMPGPGPRQGPPVARIRPPAPMALPPLQEAPRPVAGPVLATAGRQPGVQPGAAAAPPVAAAAPAPPDSVRQAIERELGGAVTIEELDRLAAQAFEVMGGDAATTPATAPSVAPSLPPSAETSNSDATAPARVIQDQAPRTDRPPTYRMEATVPEADADTTQKADSRPWLERAAEEAVAAGAFEDADTAMDEIERRGRSLYEATHGQAANEGDDRALLEHIRDRGGLLITDQDLAGEMRNLREFLDPSKVNTFAGVRNVLRRKKKVTAAEQAYYQGKGKKAPKAAGLPIDSVIEAINEDPRFAARGIHGANELLPFLVKAAVDHREGRNQRAAFDPQHFGEGAGVRLGRRWYRGEGPQVHRNDTLTPEADAVQERFARAIEDDLEGMVTRYREKFGNVIDADKVKELAGEDLEQHHEALHRPSSWLADELYERAVRETEPGMVAFTAGGPGAGKGTAIPASSARDIASAAAILRDSPLSKPQRAEEMLAQARENGHGAIAFYVYTDPATAYLRQAGRKRTAPLKYHLEAHRGALETMRRLAPQFDAVFIIDNSGAAPVDLDDRPVVDILEELAQNYPSDADIRARIDAGQADAAPTPAAPEGGDSPTRPGPQGPGHGEPHSSRAAGPPVKRRPAEVVDTLDTGEEQPRLPGDVGAVRDQDVKTAEFDAPFSLTREAAPDKKPTSGSMFLGPPVKRRDSSTERKATSPAGMPSGFLEGSVYKEALYHGSNVAGIDALRADLGTEFGIYLTPRHRYARNYGENLYRAFVNITNPKIVEGKHEISPRDLTREDADRLAREGYDSLVSSSTGRLEDATEIVVFDPDRVRIVRSAGEDVRADGGDSSPARRAYDAPPNPPKGITPPRSPVSEVAVVGELARIFGHEAKDVPGPLRGIAKRIPVPVKAGVLRTRAFGFYKIKEQVIRLQKFGDLGTFAHELGHDIDFRIFTGENAPVVDKAILTELRTLGQPTSPAGATQEYQRGEGVAEFFRYWFANPGEAQLQAPQFFTAFEAVLAKNAALARQFEQGRIVVQKYLAQDLETRGRARIDFGTTNPNDDGAGMVRTMEALWVDDLAALRRAVEQLAADQPIDVAHNAYVLSRLARGASAKASGFLAHGIRNDAGQFTGPAFRAAIAPVVDRLPDFSLYLVARRAMELKGRGIEPGMKLEEAKAILAKHESPTFADAATAVYAFQRGVVDYAVEAGVLTEKQAHSMRKLNQAYVPFWRILTDKGSTSKGGGRQRNERAPIYRIKGSGRDLVDPMQAIVRNTHALVEMVEQHKAMQAFIEQTQATPGGGLFLEEIPTPQVRTRFSFSQIRDQLAEAIQGKTPSRKAVEEGGVDAYEKADEDAERAAEILDSIEVTELLQVFTPATMASGNDRTITVMHNGQRVFYSVTDPALYEALTAVGPKATSQATRWFYKVAGAPARTLRAGATLTFGFIARNPARDSWVAFNQSGLRPDHSLRGLFSFLKQDEFYEAFLTSGGGNAAMVSADRNAIARELRELKKRGTLRDHLQTVAFHPIDTLRALSEAGEMMTRLGEYRRQLAKGGVTRETLREGDTLRATERQARRDLEAEYNRRGERRWRIIRQLEQRWAAAREDADTHGAKVRPALVGSALKSRDVTVDFARKGSLGGEINQVAAFFNARVQGYSRLVQTFRERPGVTSLRVATSVTMLSLVLWALNKDDDEYAELPAWEKNTYWHIPLAAFGGSGWLRIPKPMEFGAIFGTVFERAMDQITQRDPHAWKRIFVDDPTMDASGIPTATAKTLAKEAFAAIFPTGILPIVEAQTNYSFFRERPIVSPFDVDLPAELQFNRWTSETAKVIGRGLNVSPAMVDHLIMGYGAGLARGVVENGLDKALAVGGGPSKPPAPAAPIDRLPGIGVFAKRYAGGDAESIADLYRRREQLRGAKRTVERYAAEGSVEKATAYAGKFPDRDVEAKRVNAAAKTLEELRDLVGVVYAHQQLEPQEKRELLDRLDEHMVNTARQGLGRGPLPSRFERPLAESLARKAFERPAAPGPGRRR